MGNRKHFLIKEIVDICQRLDHKGFVANHDGNITCRFQDTLLATPSSESKADITPEMIIICDMNGNKLEGPGKPFSEIRLHLAAYRTRPEIQAVIHAHPPFATARGLCNADLHDVPIPEAIISIGNHIHVAPFTMPGSLESEVVVEELLKQTDVFIIQGNGVLSVGNDVKQAYLRLELIEHICRIMHYAYQIGTPIKLTPDQVNTLLKKRASLGLGPTQQNQDTPKTYELEDIKKAILEEIKSLLPS